MGRFLRRSLSAINIDYFASKKLDLRHLVTNHQSAQPNVEELYPYYHKMTKSEYISRAVRLILRQFSETSKSSKNNSPLGSNVPTTTKFWPCIIEILCGKAAFLDAP